MPETGTPAPSRFSYRPSRRLVIGLAVALACYALAGFVLAPWLIKRELVSVLQQTLGRQVEVARVDVNPFWLSVRVAGFRLHDHDGSVLAGFGELSVNLQLSSVFRRAVTFAQIRIVAPYLHVVREKSGDLNLMKLVPENPSAPKAKADSAPFRLIMQQFALTDGVVDLEDRVPETPFRTRLGPMIVKLQDFSTLPDASGAQNIALTLESGTRINWTGTGGVTPLRSEGQLTVKGPLLPVIYRYLHDELNFELAGGAMDLSAHFRLADEPDGAIKAGVHDLTLGITDVHVREGGGGPEVVTLPSLRLTGAEVQWPARQVTAGEVVISGLRLAPRRQADGTLNLARLFALKPAPVAKNVPVQAGGAPPAETAAPAEPAWKVTLGRFALEHMAVDFRDESLQKPAALSISDVNLTLLKISSEAGARFDLASQLTLGGGGTVNLDGTVGVLPDTILDAALRVEGVKLAQVQPYLNEFARVGIQDGSLGMSGRLASDPRELLSFTGEARISALNTLDTHKEERLLAWSELALQDLRFALSGQSLRISRVRLAKPYARLSVARDQSTNFGDVLVESPPAAAAAKPPAGAQPAAPKAAPFRVRVGKVVIAGGSSDYSDLSLPLPFAAHIVKLNGNLTAIDSLSEAPSRVSLEGQVGDYGLARIQGQIRTSSPTDLADISVLFRNVEMSPLSPYSIKFAGYKIASGKLNLDLHYRFDKRHMVGENKVVIDEIELGEKIPNPDAIDLPLGLAIALLKDSNGRIDLDLPVSGSLDDPQFSVGAVVWKAFVNLLTRIVASPFRLLGNLIGSESEDFGQIDFPPGRADLLPPELEKLRKVADALAHRPNLGVEIPAAVDPAADAVALQAAHVDALVEQALHARGGRDLDARTRAVTEELYTRAFPQQPLKALREKFTAPPSGEPSARAQLDEVAYLDELRRQLIGAQPVTPADVDALGTARAAAISAALLERSVPAARVKAGARKEVKVRDGNWVGAELQLSGT